MVRNFVFRNVYEIKPGYQKISGAHETREQAEKASASTLRCYKHLKHVCLLVITYKQTASQ